MRASQRGSRVPRRRPPTIQYHITSRPVPGAAVGDPENPPVPTRTLRGLVAVELSEAPTKRKRRLMDAPAFVWVSLVLSLLTE